MTRAPASPRRIAVVLWLALLSLVAVPTGVRGQTADDSTATAILSQDGWWNRAKGPQPSEPDNPIRSAIGGSIPAPSTVPEAGLGVGAAAGDPDKVAAIGLVLEAGLDPLVDSLVLTLAETPENGSNLNATSAKIVACPVNVFWAGVKNGDWVGRPTCDDGQGVPGTRAADGTWTFDLTLLATQWVDPTSGLDQNGVLLVEAVDAPMSFQVSFSDISTGKVATAFSATAGFADDDLSFDDEPFTSSEEVPAEGLSEVPLDDGSGASFDDGGSFAATGLGGTAASPASIGGVAGGEVATAASARPGVASNLFGGLSLLALAFLVLLGLGIAAVLAIVLGPMAAPSPVVVRSGGVSRALAARRAAAGGADR